MYKLKEIISIVAFSIIVSFSQAQDTFFVNKEGSNYRFTEIKNMEASPVVSQGNAGTCWSYSALSFFESELLRMKKPLVNLSEMFVVYHTYMAKAEKYARMHGNITFAGGGAFHDIPYVMKNYGIVPEEVYTGLNYGSDKHDHSELDKVLEGFMKSLISGEPSKLSPVWKNAVQGILASYLGEIPSEFIYQGKRYTPKSYFQSLGLNMDDYVTITSFTHHPFYTSFILELPDNWHWGSAYNVTMDEMFEIAENAIMKGYTVAWATDVSEKGFSFRDALAIVPVDMSDVVVKGSDNALFNNAGSEKKSTVFETPVPEIKITQEMRQIAFDNYETQDDHGMHITGLAKDQNGTKYFIVKNSWGTEYNLLQGYMLASEAYFKYKTTNIMVHKDALSKEMKKKLGL